MSLFDDDFYSSKISRRRLQEKLGLRRSRAPKDVIYKTIKQKNVQLVILSSVTTLIITSIIFGIIFGFSSNGAKEYNLDLSTQSVEATNRIRPAVVSIVNEQKYGLGINSQPLERNSEESGVYRDSGVGSGVIFHKDDKYAYIITNYHVVFSAHRLQIVLTTGEIREAEIVGLDKITDLAVIRIDSKGIEHLAQIGDSSELRAAEFVMTVGNPLGMGESITFGIISVPNEKIAVSLNQDGVLDWEHEVIRVDAAINQGSSGGPLIDLYGNVIGINSMKISNYGVEGIGYAIPINNVMPIVSELIESGYIARPFLGVTMLELDKYLSRQKGNESNSPLLLPFEVYDGVIVVETEGPAKAAGLQHSDVIVKMDDTEISNTFDMLKYLYNDKKIGDVVEVHYYRDKKLQKLNIVLGSTKPSF